MFRRVPLPDGVSGQLFLHSMPGRLEPFEAAKQEILDSAIREVVCLTPDEEIRHKSPEYAKAIAAGLPWRHVSHPVPDFGIPDDAVAFTKVVTSVVASLTAGENVLVHCAAGIGRTGTFAAAVMCRLGVPLDEAIRIVRGAGSSAESDAQVGFLESICG